MASVAPTGADPDAYLDTAIRQGMSMFSVTPEQQVQEGWSVSDLLQRTELDLGYRLLLAEIS